jgi:hypothetical protein
MPDASGDKGWKPSPASVAGLILGALALSAFTCWGFHINPLPTTRHVLDSGWFVTIAFIYFFFLYLIVERIRRQR